MECHERWQAFVVKLFEPFQFLNKRCGIIAAMAQPILLADCLRMAVDVVMFSGGLSSISGRLSGRHVHFSLAVSPQSDATMLIAAVESVVLDYLA